MVQSTVSLALSGGGCLYCVTDILPNVTEFIEMQGSGYCGDNIISYESSDDKYCYARLNHTEDSYQVNIMIKTQFLSPDDYVRVTLCDQIGSESYTAINFTKYKISLLHDKRIISEYSANNDTAHRVSFLLTKGANGYTINAAVDEIAINYDAEGGIRHYEYCMVSAVASGNYVIYSEFPEAIEQPEEPPSEEVIVQPDEQPNEQPDAQPDNPPEEMTGNDDLPSENNESGDDEISENQNDNQNDNQSESPDNVQENSEQDNHISDNIVKEKDNEMGGVVLENSNRDKARLALAYINNNKFINISAATFVFFILLLILAMTLKAKSID